MSEYCRRMREHRKMAQRLWGTEAMGNRTVVSHDEYEAGRSSAPRRPSGCHTRGIVRDSLSLSLSLLSFSCFLRIIIPCTRIYIFLVCSMPHGFCSPPHSPFLSVQALCVSRCLPINAIQYAPTCTYRDSTPICKPHEMYSLAW